MAPREIIPELSGRAPLGLLRQLILSGEHCRNVLARRLELGTSDLEVILHLFSDGPQTPHQLGTKMDMTSGTMTALLDRVEKAGFLTRRNNPSDRRSLLISMTPAGQHAAQWVDDHFDATLKDALATSSELEVHQFKKILSELGLALEARARADIPA